MTYTVSILYEATGEGVRHWSAVLSAPTPEEATTKFRKLFTNLNPNDSWDFYKQGLEITEGVNPIQLTTLSPRFIHGLTNDPNPYCYFYFDANLS
jgi:hypothetical protein